MTKVSISMQDLRRKIYIKAHITLDVNRTGKPCEGNPHAQFDEKMLEIGYG